MERVEHQRIEMDEKRLALNHEIIEEERSDRKRVCEERKEEREAAAELDLKKMKLMMDMLMGCMSKGAGKDGRS